MSRKKLLSRLMLVTLMITLLVGCQKPIVEKEGIDYPLTLTDSFDRQVTIAAEPQSIVSLAPSSTEMLFALGLGDKVIGVTDACDYPEAALAIEKMGGYQGVNVEKIVAAEPGLIIADSLTTKEVVEQLASLGLPVLAIKAETVEDVLANFTLIGKAANVTADAAELNASLQARLDAVATKIDAITDADRPLVFYEVWHDSLMSAGPDTFIGHIVTAAGGENAMADAATDWPELDLEILIGKNPDIVLLGHDAESPAEVLVRPNWQTIAAVKDERVFAMNPDIFNRPGPRIVDAVETLAKILHPDLFE